MMKAARYANAFVQNTPIMLGRHPEQFGTLLSEYRVHEYWDLRTTSGGGAPVRSYMVSLRQRLTLANSNAFGFTKLDSSTSYSGYPILAAQSVTPKPQSIGIEFYLEDYSPKTLNASVAVSQNQGTSANTSSSTQHTSGSSTSTTNSYEVSGSLGFFGMDLTGGGNFGYSHSTTNTEEHSTSQSRGQDMGFQSGTSSSMSVKDWASYGMVDATKQLLTWVWGQEYPWNIIDFRGSSDGATPDLPQYVQKRLWDGSFLYPPSQISQFGLNFVGHAQWAFFTPEAPDAVDEVVDFAHGLTYWLASHSVDQATGKLSTAVQPVAENTNVETVRINLPVLSLEPIIHAGSRNGAVTGFVKTEFITLPGEEGRAFRLKSSANNLYISQGKGFGGIGGDDAILTANNITSQSPASFTVQCKIIDPDLELSLHLKHWLTSLGSCKLTIKINGETIVRHVDSMNASSGADNITVITLRSRDYTAPDYYDYLVIGLNTITVVAEPGDGAKYCSYALRALAIQ